MTEIGKDFKPLSKYLDGLALRHRVLAQNMANANTPNYRRMDVNFSRYVEDLIGAGSESNPSARPEIVAGEGAVKPNGNNVDIDRENGYMDQNMILYRTVTQLLTMKIDLLRAAITRNR